MKKRFALICAAITCLCLAAGCAQYKNSVDQGGMTVFPVSSYDDSLEIYLGDVMPFYDDGVMNVYHLQNSTGSQSIFYHPISRLTTTDFVNYTDCGIAINYESEINSPDAAIGTGSFIKDKNGNYHCFYTGHNDNGQEEGLKFNEAVRHAVSYDNQNTWVKDEDFLLYGYENDFRDPYVYYDEDDELYYMLVTTQHYGCGVIKQYASATLDASADEWEDRGIFFTNDDGTYNMECPSYIEWNGFYYLVYSEQGESRVTHYRYKTSKDGEWEKFGRDSIDATGFYAGRLEKAGDELYAFAWCANLSGGSTGDFDWGGNLVVHQIEQLSSGELCAVMVSSVKQAISNKITYRLCDGSKLNDLTFDGENFSAVCLEKLGRGITRMHFDFTVESLDGDFGITFGIGGAYHNRLGQSLVSFDVKDSELSCYNDVTSVLRYGSALATVPFTFAKGRTYGVDILVQGEIIAVYLDDTVSITARFTDMVRRNFAFYSNGVKVKIGGMEFYE